MPTPKDGGGSGDQLAPPAPMLTAISPTSPANNNNPTITGTAEAGSTVTIYGDSACTMMLATGTAAALASPGITIAVTDDTTFAFAAVARDAADNASPCSAALTFVEDSTAPATPALTGTLPGSPSRSVVPTVQGTGEPGATVTIYGNTGCTGSAIGTGTINGAGDFATVATVPPAVVTSIAAIVKDAAGNASPCSSPISYEQNASAVAVPTFTATTPVSPSSSVTMPVITGTAEAGVTVRLFAEPTCSGTPLATGVVNASSAYSITVTVAANSTTTYYAQALDTSVNQYSQCSAANIIYQHDSQKPLPPVVSNSVPASPSNSGTPIINGTAEGNSLVRLFTDSACAGTVAAMGTAAGNGTYSIMVTTAADATFYARATDAAGNISDCSTANVAYDYDATAPAAPMITDTTPVSPSATDNTPIVEGTAEANTTVRIYLSGDCTGSLAGSTMGSSTAFAIPITVPSNQATMLTATATDVAGNTSGCSGSVPYVHDSLPPGPPAITMATPGSPANNNSPMISGTAEMGTTVQLYTDATCTTTKGSSAVATSGTFTIPITVTDNTTTTLYAKAVDTTGNQSTCSAQAFTYAEDSAAPTAPILTSLAASSTDTTPTIAGSSESGTTISIYANANCSGTAAVTTTAPSGSFSADVTVTANSQTPISAKATDGAGNASTCSNTFTYIHDNMTPGVPTGLASTPVSPASSNNPSITGMAETGSTVRLYTNVGCSTAVAGSATASGGTFTVPLTVSNDTTTTFYATATDAAGNASACSTSFVQYIEDSTNPVAPTSLATSPPSPSANAAPNVTGTAEASSTVKLFTNSACSGTAAFSGTALGGGTFTIATTVTVNSTTTFWATATDAAGNASTCSLAGVPFVHDNVLPGTPVITATTPGSPANNNAPTVTGTAETGTTVKLYTSVDCTTGFLNSGPATGGAFSIGLTGLGDNTTTNIYANATDSANNVSGCSAIKTYVEDSLAPPTPTGLATNPTNALPRNNNDPLITGTSEMGATITVYALASCAGTIAGTATAGSGGTFSVPVSVGGNTSTTFSAKASDAAGNESTCSTSITYIEDSDPPSTPVISGTTPTSPGNDTTPTVAGTGDTGATVKIFTTSNCTTGQVGSGAVTGGTFSISLSTPISANLLTTLYANATDTAGNVSGCSTGLAYTEDSTPPGLPSSLATNPVSPANANNPSLTGVAEAGSTVRAYSDAACSVQAGVSVIAGPSGAFAIALAVADNVTTTFRVQATDSANNTSACSATASITYQEDSTQVETPVITATNPLSPSKTSTTPTVSGTTIAGYTVNLYTTANCTGSTVGTQTLSGTPPTGASFSIANVTATSNATTTYYAKAVLGVNSSGCSSGFAYTHDNTVPGTPTSLIATPAGPANNNQPVISGSAESGTTVTLWTNNACTLPVGNIGSGTASAGAFSIQVQAGKITDSTTTTIYALSTDAATNASACSTGVTYVEDSAAPTAPTVSTTTPPTPSNSSTTPTVNGTAENNATIKIYTTASCTGSAIATGTASAAGAFSIAVSVSQNSSTTFKATATDAAGNVSACSSTSVTYVHDNQPPGTPTGLTITPVGPANNNSPTASGSAETGATVTIHTSNTCTIATQVGSQVAAGGTFTTIALTNGAPDNATTTFYARATDSAGNQSGCSTGVAYVEDSTNPATPVFMGSTPASPSKTSTTPTINGTAEAGATVSLYSTAGCSNLVATGTATGSPAAFVISVTVTANTSTTFYARATDAAGNNSACTSAGFIYTHDSSPPSTPTLSGTTPASPANNNSPTLNGTSEANATINVYTSSDCTTSVASGVANGAGAFAVTVSVSDNTSTTMYAKATDAAGNSSACTSTFVTYIEDSSFPGVPTLSSTNPVSPSSNNTPVTAGSGTNAGAETAVTVKLFSNSSCTALNQIGSGTASLGTGGTTYTFAVTATLTNNAVTTIYGNATDAAGNVSACSATSITYTEDSTAPATPSNLGSTPTSPANNNAPSITGTAETGATVKLYTTSNCTGTFASAVAASNAFSIAASVVNNTSTTFYATATDASNNVSGCSAGFTFVEDSLANAPALTSTTPGSPSAASTTPSINGTGETGATIKLFTNNACSGVAIASGTIASGTFSVSVSVTANTSTTFFGSITDLAGNNSACSSGITYVHDNTTPTMGTVTSATATSNTQIFVQWTAGSDNLTATGNIRYDVCWKTVIGGSCIGTATTLGGATSHTITGLTASTRYFVYVAAVDLVGNSTGFAGPKSDRTWGVGTNIEVSAGEVHTCSLLSDGTVRCWGGNGAGQLGNGTTTESSTPVDPGLNDVIGIAAGGEFSSAYGFTCAVKADGTVWCWGADMYGQLGNDVSFTNSNVPVQVSGISNAVKVAANAFHACALLGTGAIKCWGWNGDGGLGNNTTTNSGVPVSVSSITTAFGLDVGAYHSCAVLGDGTLRCWGENGSGQLGNGSNTNSLVPVTVSLGTGNYAKSITTGSYHSCALLGTGNVRCWGANASGQLGTNSTTASNVPVAVTTNGSTALINVYSVTAGGTYAGTGEGTTCIIAYTGAMQCWGDNSNGQLGNSATGTDLLVPATVTSAANAKQVSVGRYHTCYLATDGTLKCFGNGANYRLGTGTTTSVNVQASVANLTGPEMGIMIRGSNGGFNSAGHSTCALMSSGLVRCWGDNAYGQLGTNDTTTRYVPGAPVVTSTNIPIIAKSITVGEQHACAVLGDGNIRCWGLNTDGQLGDGTNVSKSYAASLSSLAGATSVSAGNVHTCAFLVNGDVRCTGDNFYGQLGNGTTTDSNTVVTTGVGAEPRLMEAHGFGGCVAIQDGTMKCWGWNGYGGLGDTTTVTQTSPVTTSGAANVTSLGSGRWGMCGSSAGGAAKCAGHGGYGQMGNGTTTSTNSTPVTVTGGNFLKLGGGGEYHHCGVMVGGNVKCWGINGSGQIGNNSTTTQTSPVQVTGLANVKDVGVGRIHACALHADGTAECWGNGTYGQLGDNNSTAHQSNVAAPVVYFP